MIYSILKGRIGNNLFQIAAGYSLASRLNTGFVAYIPDFVLPEPDSCTLKKYLEQFRNNLLRNIEFTGSLPRNIPIYSETSDLSYRELPSSEDLVLEGYFQSEKYFTSELVRALFSIDNVTQKEIYEKYGTLLGENPVSVNVRRGDFVKQPHLHPVCSKDYFNSAMDYFGKDQKFMIISDDIEWCRRNFRGRNFYFIDEEPPLIDLYLQTMCRGNIISNSTFSWWGAWLNPDTSKTVIAPAENWTGKLHPYKFSDDLIPESWLKFRNPLDKRSRIIVFKKQFVREMINIKKRIQGRGILNA